MIIKRRFYKTSTTGFAVTIGNFDGLHIGHQAILNTLKMQAKARGLSPLVLSFEPHPVEFFQKNNTPPRLTQFREKACLLKDAGIDFFVCLPFEKKLSTLSATQFIQNILKDLLNTKYLLIGDDFRFGHQRQGDVDLLKKLGGQHGFSTEIAPTVLMDSRRVSSTWVRETLIQGDFDTTQKLLGRNYAMMGRVIKGDARGRLLGFRTANIRLNRMTPALLGVFVVKVFWGKKTVWGVANLGTRPTVDGLKTLLEVHLFQFDQDLYGERLTVEFLHKIRDEQRFNSIEALQNQILQDVKTANDWLSLHFCT